MADKIGGLHLLGLGWRILRIGSELAADEGLEDAAALCGLGALGLDVGVGKSGCGDDEGDAGEEEAGGGGALGPGRRVLHPNHLRLSHLMKE